jgi:hypothetical protein
VAEHFKAMSNGLTMEAAQTSEMLVNLYQSTRRYNPEGSHLYTHRRENLRSYLLDLLSNMQLSVHYS